MAYIKYKELAQYFNFFKTLDIMNLPTYVTDYIEDDEDIYAGYSTYRDKCIFTNKKIILFDQRGLFGKTKKIHFFPFHSISSTAIEYKERKTSILLSMDSGYQLRLDFITQQPIDKTNIRHVYFKMIEQIDELKTKN